MINDVYNRYFFNNNKTSIMTKDKINTHTHTFDQAVQVKDGINQISKEALKKRKTFDPSNNKFCGFRGVWEIYPDDNWNVKKWGPKPLLGYVRADDEYWAIYAAYNKGIALPNCTFGYVAKKAQKFVRNI